MANTDPAKTLLFSGCTFGDAAADEVDVVLGRGIDEPARVGLVRVLVDVFGGAELDDLAVVHDGHHVGHEFHDAQVVADEDVGEAAFVLQLLEQIQHLGLDADVERRDRFVADDELGAGGERPGDADALALAAGEFVRVAAEVIRGEADFAEQLRRRGRGGRRGSRRCVG